MASRLDADLAWTSLALLASGPNPERGRVVCVAAVHVRGGVEVERFNATLNPGVRVPGYVAERLGTARELFEELPPFASIADELVGFLGARPLVAQDARLTWAFVKAEARRAGHLLADPPLIDANELATRLLDLEGKPSLALVAARLGIGTIRVPSPEKRRACWPWSRRACSPSLASTRTSSGAPLVAAAPQTGATSLRRTATARALPDEPGVYVMRDTDQTPLYVGKARRLRSRVAAYVHRPLGATRRLEGLVGAVHAVDSTACATDLEALVLEDREIRRLAAALQHGSPAARAAVVDSLAAASRAASRQRQPAPDDSSRALGPVSGSTGEFVGPFRNEALADSARLLARRVFDLDALRRANAEAYADQPRAGLGFFARRDRRRRSPRPSALAPTVERGPGLRRAGAVAAGRPARGALRGRPARAQRHRRLRPRSGHLPRLGDPRRR